MRRVYISPKYSGLFLMEGKNVRPLNVFFLPPVSEVTLRADLTMFMILLKLALVNLFVPPRFFYSTSPAYRVGGSGCECLFFQSFRWTSPVCFHFTFHGEFFPSRFQVMLPIILLLFPLVLMKDAFCAFPSPSQEDALKRSYLFSITLFPFPRTLELQQPPCQFPRP